uniref:Death domain-containing protein n=1 Tax=Amphimedon queenslandica TaxID=400682 RepID=A0A1X7SXM7_AMPQE
AETSESPPSKRSRTVQPTGLLDTSNLIDVLDVLGKHGYSGVSYYKLGLRLGLHSGTLDVIEKDNKGDTNSCLRKCLTAWLEQRDSVMRRGRPTYDTLIQALRDEGENAVADGIERDINSKE